jgi:hypothetical protein
MEKNEEKKNCLKSLIIQSPAKKVFRLHHGKISYRHVSLARLGRALEITIIA